MLSAVGWRGFRVEGRLLELALVGGSYSNFVSSFNPALGMRMLIILGGPALIRATLLVTPPSAAGFSTKDFLEGTSFTGSRELCL